MFDDPIGVATPSLYLDVLFGGARPSTLVEVRWRTSVGMDDGSSPWPTASRPPSS